MSPPSPWSIASIAVPLACLIVGFVGFWGWWRRVRGRLEAREVQVLPLHARQVVREAEEERGKVAFPTLATRRGSPAGLEGGGRPQEEQRRQRPNRLSSSATLSITTTLTPSGGDGDHRTRRVLLSRRRSRQLSLPRSDCHDGSTVRASQGSFADAEGAATIGMPEKARRRDGLELRRRDWGGEFEEGRGEGGEGTEELTDEAVGVQQEVEVPESAEWIAGGVGTFDEARKREMERRKRRTSEVVAPSPVQGGDDPLGEFIALLAPSPPPRAYGPRSNTSAVVLSGEPSHPSTSTFGGEYSSLSRSQSGTTMSAHRSSSYEHGVVDGTQVNPPVPAFPSQYSPPLPPLPPTSPLQYDTQLHSHHSHASLPPHRHRPPTRSAPTLLETALLRSTSAPHLRRPNLPQRERTDPLPVLAASSSADFYGYPDSPLASSTTFFFSPSSTAEYHGVLSSSPTYPPPPAPAWPPSPPRTPQRSSPRSPPLTDFPPRNPSRPPRSSRPPLSTSSRSLPSSSFGPSVDPPLPPPSSSSPGLASRFSFRSTRKRMSSQSMSLSPGLRWSGSWSKGIGTTSAAGREEAGGGSRRVSRELLKPLRTSVRRKAFEEEDREELGDAEKEEGVEARERSNSVGTLESHVQRGVAAGKGGAAGGGLTLTNPDVTAPSSSSASAVGRPSAEFSASSHEGRGGARMSFETARVGVVV
ncbi:hypothetical protein JCM8547_005674 [Rhodosporidiobolus lusitaniae]